MRELLTHFINRHFYRFQYLESDTTIVKKKKKCTMLLTKSTQGWISQEIHNKYET